ncbi:PEP-CTERM sorting domain-containing protein [Rhodopirellula sp. JC740]|uniref:PEP-CTERM sorting domain-containing protein n=1 Tax=Rhodopirellula halodulae TaxID=2894198 RepID=A0ABS8NAY9_9BACT|nr:PEP-CTERM sorting domain-containing protein [Rhodopirellula sp. JC740]MCC9640715.1 PEP-CTERM sorting domain-containing protein [Rhodopirellula sp. JC740]
MLLPLILLATSFSGYADLVYDFRFGQTSYEAASGTSVNVDIFFRETATAGEDLRFFADGVGLTGLGPIGVGYGPNAPATSVLSIANLTDISVSSDFSDGQFRTRDNSSFKAEIGGQENAGISIGTNQTFHEILLGSITFEVVGNAGDTASLTLTPNDFGDIFFDNDLLPTATANFDSAGFNVIAVPEPSSCALIGVAISALALRRRRCKNQ